MDGQRRTLLLALGCLGAAGTLIIALAIGVGLGYLVFRARQASPPATATAAPAIHARATVTPRPAPSLTTPRASVPAATSPVANAPHATPTRSTAQPPTPTPAPPPPPPPTPTPPPPPAPPPQSAPAPAPPAPSVPADWQSSYETGYLVLRYPPGWLMVTTPDYPEYNLHTCHRYWILMSQPMGQNSPDAETVRDWFNSRAIGKLVPGSIWIEILRADSEDTPPVDFGQRDGRR